MNEYLIVSDEVRDAIEKDLPVVAFETSILTHGLPQPHNVDPVSYTHLDVYKRQPETVGIQSCLRRE